MSLVRLLAAGKSLVGLNDSSRYRVANRNVLPRFDTAKNPFHSESGTKRSEPSVTGEVPVAAVVDSDPTMKAAIPMSLVARIGRGFDYALTKASSLLRRTSKPRAKTGLPSAPGAEVQPELALDRVRVVRNDLSDADLEIVTGQAAGSKAAPAAPLDPSPNLPEPPLGPAETARIRAQATVRLMGAGKS